MRPGVVRHRFFYQCVRNDLLDCSVSQAYLERWGIAKVGIEEDRVMLRIRTHRLELARNRIERDLKRIAIQHSRQPGGALKPNSELKAVEAAKSYPRGRPVGRR
jgi:hypothetical protein